MNFKPLEKIFDRSQKEKIEKISLENGVVKTVYNEFGLIDFSKKETIDTLEYDFHLSKRKEDKEWNLGFGTKHGVLITNKGLVVYRQIIENVIVLVNTARKNQKVDRISFFGANEDLRIDEVEEFKNFLKSKIKNGGYIFDNFSFTKKIDDWKRSLQIRDGQVSIEESGERPFSLVGKIIGQDKTWERSNTFSIKQFVDNEFEMKELLDDKEALSALMEHIGADFSLGRSVNKKDAAKLRADMYERTLKQRFPDYKFERDGNTITLSL